LTLCISCHKMSMRYVCHSLDDTDQGGADGSAYEALTALAVREMAPKPKSLEV